MKYHDNVPHFDDNPNITKRSLFKTLFLILGGLLASIVLLYIVLIFFINLMIANLPEKYEITISNLLIDSFKEEGIDEEKTAIVREYLKELSDKKIEILVVESNTVNAIALPGNLIVIYSGLYDKLSADELRFIIGHEIGHLANNDNMKLLSRSSLRAIISSTIFDESIGVIIDKSLYLVSLAFSRNNEINADIYSINLLKSKGFATKGVTKFFEKFDTYEDGLNIYLSTHPHPKSRIKAIEKVEEI